MKPDTRLRIAAAAAACACIGALGLLAHAAAGGDPGETAMKPSVTYLHLLRHTPFFTRLDTPQLRWTIDHSHEWEAQPGTVVADCGAGGQPRDDAIWILLDGRWQVEENGRAHPAGHADPGKWFSAAATKGACRLVVTERSYVMKIERKDMDDMLARGFAFDGHLQDGQAYYAAMFAAAATD